jgi:hypothetical protein
MEPKSNPPSQNARTHGLTGEKLILAAEEQAKFDELSAFLREDLKPQDQFEESCFSRIVNSAWRLDQAQAAENRALSDFMNAPEDPELQKRFERFTKYRRHYERCFSTALRDLRTSQENRFIQQHVTLPENTILAPTLPVRAILRDFKKFQNELPKALSMGLVADSIFDESKLTQLTRAAEDRRREDNRKTANSYWAPIDPTRVKPPKTNAA